MTPKVSFLLNLLNHLSEEKEEWAYLRNYECLPDSTGNDVDLLVREGRRGVICRILQEFAQSSGWEVTKVVYFSPLTVYFRKGDETLHIDLFDRIEWHCLPFANVSTLMDARILKGEIWTLDAGSESFINVMTRHIYEGIVREKHREQFKSLDEEARIKFTSLLEAATGQGASGLLMKQAITGDWDSFERGHKIVRRNLSLNSVTKSPVQVLVGLVRYVSRTVKRLAFPPGTFIAFEGIDGPEKSTVIQQCSTMVRDKFSCAGPMHFHGKPLKIGTSVDVQAPVDPQKIEKLGLLSLFRHWIGFQYGYWLEVRPQLVRNRLVVGNGYVYDLLLNPLKYGLGVPNWCLSWAVSLVRKPSLTIGFAGSAHLFSSPKQKLTVEEIEEYHQQLERLGEKVDGFWLVPFDEDVAVTCSAVLRVTEKAMSEQ